MASILEGYVFRASVTDAVEALDIGRGGVVGVLKRPRAKGPIPIELHFVRGAYFLPFRLLEGGTAFRFQFERVHAPLFPMGEPLSRAAAKEPLAYDNPSRRASYSAGRRVGPVCRYDPPLLGP